MTLAKTKKVCGYPEKPPNKIGGVMELKVSERLVILSVLPKEGNITTMRIAQELKNNLGFDLVEYRELNFVDDGGKVTWEGGDPVKEVPINDIDKGIIRTAFRELSNRNKLREEHIPLYEKFVEDK